MAFTLARALKMPVGEMVTRMSVREFRMQQAYAVYKDREEEKLREQIKHQAQAREFAAKAARRRL